MVSMVAACMSRHRRHPQSSPSWSACVVVNVCNLRHARYPLPPFASIAVIVSIRDLCCHSMHVALSLALVDVTVNICKRCRRSLHASSPLANVAVIVIVRTLHQWCRGVRLQWWCSTAMVVQLCGCAERPWWWSTAMVVQHVQRCCGRHNVVVAAVLNASHPFSSSSPAIFVMASIHRHRLHDCSHQYPSS